MKEYAYFPGCSLEKIGLSYHQSSLETTSKLDIQLKELEDWNCCGATTYFHVDELLAYTLCARNLAMAEKENLDFVAPCSACFKNSFFTNIIKYNIRIIFLPFSFLNFAGLTLAPISEEVLAI